jgi:hypothetical protein
MAREASGLHTFRLGLAEYFRLFGLTPAIAVKANQLSDAFHGDPFDRTIVATAAILGLTIITTDPAIRDAKQCTASFGALGRMAPCRRYAWRDDFLGLDDAR